MSLGTYLILCAAVCATGAAAELVAPGSGVLTMLLAAACTVMAAGVLVALIVGVWSRSARSKTWRPR